MPRFTITLEWRGMTSDRQMAQFSRLCEATGFGPQRKSRKPWVAKITGLCPTYKFTREFIAGQIDYSQSNSKGSRGVYLYFHPEPDGIYEVAPKGSIAPDERYFIHAWQTTLNTITADQAAAWFRENDRLASTC